MPAYQEQFPIGARVRVRDRSELESFRAAWKLHNPLISEQMKWAGHETSVADIGFYHGGDVLYVLDGIPGIWHEACLVQPSVAPT